MADNTITLILDGDVSLTEFARAIGNFSQLVKSLSAEIAKTHLEWMLDTLEVSSALASTAELSETEDAQQEAQKVIAAYAQVGAALQAGHVIPFPGHVQELAIGLVSSNDERIKSVRFETAESESIIPVRRPWQEQPAILEEQRRSTFPTHSYGAVRGRIQTLSNRGRLHFTLYDLLYDKAVSCYLAEGKQELLRDLWGRLVTVEGFVTRDGVTGRPLSIRGVAEITPLPEPIEGMDYRSARSIVPSQNNLSPEDAIRRIRDDS